MWVNFAEVESSALGSRGKESEIIAVTAQFQVRYYFPGKNAFSHFQTALTAPLKVSALHALFKNTTLA